MGTRMPTVGVVGLGFGRAHVAAFQAAGCQVVAVCQRRGEVAQAVARQYDVPGTYERWEEMLEQARPEIVVIAAPPHLHRPIALRALETGAHVLCEKPLALDTGEARAMVEAARRAGRVAMTCFNWRFPAAMQRFRALVEAGHLGRLFHASARYLVSRWAEESVAPTWRMDRAQAGHGVMGDVGVHLIDLVRWHWGEVARVTARAGIAHPARTVPGGGRPADAEDFCTVVAEMATGAQVTLEASRAARGMNDLTLEAFGSAGALAFRLERAGRRWWLGALRAASGDGPLARVPVRGGLPASAGEGNPLEVTGRTLIAPLVRRMLDGISRGESPSPSFEDGMRAQAVLDAVLASERQGGWVAVEG